MASRADTQPLVSVVTPVYNGQAYLAECIESVLAQSYSNWQYTVVNNCSTDATLGDCKALRRTGFQNPCTQQFPFPSGDREPQQRVADDCLR